MRTLQRLLLCIICLTPTLAAQSSNVDLTKVSRAVQDSTGQIWGAGYPMSPSLYRWEGDKWNIVVVDGVPSNSRPVALASQPDGAVYCLWSDGHGDHTVTWHQGADSRKVAEFSGDVTRVPSLFVDPRKNIWITDRGIHIYRITPEGKAETAYTCDYDHRWDSNRPQNSYINFQSVFATADGQGRVWFWSGGPAGGGVPALQGILIFDGDKFELHSDLPGLPGGSYPAVEPDDAGHMWVAASRDRLYRVDTETLTAEVVPEPAPKAFHFTQSIFTAGGATYVVAVNGLVPVVERSGEGRFGALWQRQQDGEWKRVINGLDMRPETLMDPHRSFVETPEGLWLGAYGTGPWFIPAGQGEPVHIDWRHGFSLAGSESLKALPDGRLLVVAAASGSMAVKPAELLASFESPADVRTINPLRVLVVDRQNHFWGFLSGEKVISEWDGKTWTDHALPQNIDPLQNWNSGVDSQDRIWLFSDRCKGDINIFNPHGGNVENYPDFSSALQAQLPNRASFELQGNHLTVPIFTPDGRIGYHDGCGQAHYFNGQAWQTWKPQEIDATHPGNFDGPAFFDHAGNFAVNIAGKTWEYAAAEGWHAVNPERGTGADPGRFNPRATAPPGCEVRNPESVAVDRLGTYWLTSRGQLYRAVPGRSVPQFSADQRQPFSDLRTIRNALIDPQGNVFLETYFRGQVEVGEYVVLNARQPLPQTSMHARVEATGIVKLHFETQIKGKVWFRWRVDGGDWTTPLETPDATVDWLANGPHRFEAATLDEHLQFDPTPAVANVTLLVDTQQQLAALVEQLKASDYTARDAAVSALVRQAATALPLLQSARAHATPDQQWWIDAAIQQIEDKLAKSGKQ